MPSVSRQGQQDLIAQYRDATLRHAKLAGITRPSFRCQRCRKDQGVSGRRQVVRGTSRYGYYCAHCAALAGR
ncbi:hypothetical protein CGK74_18180 [Thauera propionica]|jgi:hypothetical protein|uniref:Uncharacterized protein n=1 Tax=Thauera propionica TaxID=2019431 RepID=A0A235ETS1_9RHOO|nr:hypothetical protein CGK74_18180 [Thauera propionica]